MTQVDAAEPAVSVVPEPPATRAERDGGDPLLDVASITKRFGDIEAVKRLSFSVHAGELFTLLGPSGCGKTTTLMALAGFETPDEGSIDLAGRNITREPPERRGMGVVFQNYALFPHMSVLENVMFPLQMRGVQRSQAAETARASLRQVDLAERHERATPLQLSGGQQQRVALARAIVFDPPVLLMDEPLAALDRQLRQSLQFELRRLQTRLHSTVIYVTHDQEEALVLSDRIAVMRDGTFEQVGTPQEVYDRPANAFVAGFLGSSNRVPVKVVRRSDGRVEVAASNHEPLVLDREWPRDQSDAVLMVRPERVSLASASDSPSAGDELRVVGRIQDVAFLGDHLRLECEVFGEAKWTLRVPPEAAARVSLGAGEDCTLVWSPSDTHLLVP